MGPHSALVSCHRYQGLKESCFPALLDQFASSHQCNTFCEMLGLKPLKGPEATHPQAKAKGSKPKLVCVKTKEEMLSSGSSVEPLTAEGIT